MSWNNQVVLIGSLGADPELRFTQGGTAVLNFRIATTEKWKDASGVQKEETEWSTCVMWNKAAEDAAPHLRKGSYVRVEGRLKTEMYEKDGVKHYPTKIVVSHIAPAAFPKPDRAQGSPMQAGNPIPFGTPQVQPNPYGPVDDVTDLY